MQWVKLNYSLSIRFSRLYSIVVYNADNYVGFLLGAIASCIALKWRKIEPYQINPLLEFFFRQTLRPFRHTLSLTTAEAGWARWSDHNSRKRILIAATSIYVHYVVYFVACSIFNMSKTTGGCGTSAKSVRNRHLQQSDPWIVGKNWVVMFLVVGFRLCWGGIFDKYRKKEFRKGRKIL